MFSRSNHNGKALAILLIGMGGVLCAGLILQSIALVRTHRSAGRVEPLSRNLPQSIPGWMSREEKLGPTEFESESARAALNFDDMFYWSYTRGTASLSLYAAYWRAGRMQPQLIDSHTPDICWVAAGWNIRDGRNDDVVRAGSTALRATRGRSMYFPPTQTRQYVAYWHLLGTHLYSQPDPTNAVSRATLWQNAVRAALEGPQPQYFIRLASTVPFEQLADDPGFQEVVRALAKLGLEDRGAVRDADTLKR